MNRSETNTLNTKNIDGTQLTIVSVQNGLQCHILNYYKCFDITYDITA